MGTDIERQMADHRLRVLVEEALAEADRSVRVPPVIEPCHGDGVVDRRNAAALADYSAALVTTGLLRRLLSAAGIPVTAPVTESELRMLWGDR